MRPPIFAAPRLSLRFVPIWRRHFLVWRKLTVPSILGNLADPLLYMLGFGYGLGALLPRPAVVAAVAAVEAPPVVLRETPMSFRPALLDRAASDRRPPA